MFLYFTLLTCSLTLSFLPILFIKTNYKPIYIQHSQPSSPSLLICQFYHQHHHQANLLENMCWYISFRKDFTSPFAKSPCMVSSLNPPTSALLFSHDHHPQTYISEPRGRGSGRRGREEGGKEGGEEEGRGEGRERKGGGKEGGGGKRDLENGARSSQVSRSKHRLSVPLLSCSSVGLSVTKASSSTA